MDISNGTYWTKDEGRETRDEKRGIRDEGRRRRDEGEGTKGTRFIDHRPSSLFHCHASIICHIGKALYFGILIGLTTLAGCSITGGPRTRLGYLPTDTFGIFFPDPDNLGAHSYGLGVPDRGGIVYTCKGGHIDLDHIRGNADNTRYLANKIRETLSKGKEGFSFKITGEASTNKVRFTYPQDWDQQPDKDRIIEEIAFDTAAYLSFNATIWHEILTWFGVHYALIEPEFNSAFSWEDMYSNVIGTQIGVEAMKDQDRDFDAAMTAAIYRRLEELEVQPRSTAIAASDKVRGQWYTGNFVPDVKMRNFDIGLDGSVTPTLVPGVEGCDSEPLPLAGSDAGDIGTPRLFKDP